MTNTIEDLYQEMKDEYKTSVEDMESFVAVTTQRERELEKQCRL